MKKNKLPSLVSILVLTLITGIVWVSLSTYRAFTAKPAESVPEEISNPLTPTLDQAVIGKIETGIFFDSSQIPEIAVTAPLETTVAQPTGLPQPTATPEATASGVPNPSP